MSPSTRRHRGRATAQRHDEIARWDATSQTWIGQGDVIELSGKSRNCAWDAVASVCR